MTNITPDSNPPLDSVKPVIWKFPIESMRGVISLPIPKDAKILSIQVQHGTPCIWALIPDPRFPAGLRHFRVYGTGQPIDQMGTYIGTFQLTPELVYAPDFVGHLFEVQP